MDPSGPALADSARHLARNAQNCESDGNYAQAAGMHEEAARLFRLASVAPAGERETQQMRMLARHHDSRARACREQATRAPSPAPDAVAMSVMKSGELGQFVGGPSAARASRIGSGGETGGNAAKVAVNTAVVSPRSAMDQSTLMQPPTRPSVVTPEPHAAHSKGWLEAFEALVERFFAKDDSPAMAMAPTAGRPDEPFSDGEETTNRLLDSFLVLPDYKGAAAIDVAAPRRDAPLKVSTGSSDDLRDLVDRLSRQNEALSARVHELEAERKTIKQSVMQFRDVLERSVNYPLVAPGLENLLDNEAQSVLRTPSPVSPDLVEYCRTLERKVEEQALELSNLRRATNRK